MLRYTQFLRPERQRQYLLGRMLLRVAISRHLGVPTDGITIIDQPNAGPRLYVEQVEVTPGVSLSHSGSWIACATSRHGAIGVDIEVIDTRRDVLALAQAAFASEEYAWVGAQPPAKRVDAFYTVWTRKEALFKLHCNQGKALAALPLVVHGDALISHSAQWIFSSAPHSLLAVAVCAQQSLEEVVNIEVDELDELA